MDRNFFLKIFWLLALCALVALVPWWAVLGAMLFPLFSSRSFYEGVVVGAVMDIMYGPAPGFLPFPFFAVTVVMVFAVPILKRRLVFWRNPSF